jgi:hypothetical protein
MSALTPSFGVAAAIRADIIGFLRSRGSPEEMANNIAPSLSVINQWSTQIPLLLSPNSPPGCMDLIFSLRKDLFVGPLFVLSVFGTPICDLPEPFQKFSTFIREVIASQKSDKPHQKVRFLIFLIVHLLMNIFSPQSVPA